jgi:predicted helicase
MKKSKCQVFHGEIFGLRKEKFEKLENFSLEELCKTELFPKDDMFYFIPRDTTLEKEFLQFWSVKDIFEVKNTGIISKRDKFCMESNEEVLLNRIDDFRQEKYSTAEICEKYNLRLEDKDRWNAKQTISNLRTIQNLSLFIQDIDYRPFEKKKIFYENSVVARRVFDVMQHMLDGENLAILIGRAGNVTGSSIWDIVFISDSIVDLNMFRRGGEVVFPLYLNPKKIENSLLDNSKTPNFTPKFREFLQKDFPNISPETVFYYIYGILYSPKYREKYREFLQTDFPRIDFGRDISEISKLGKELADLHLLKHQIFKTPKNWNLKKVGENLTINLGKKSEICKDGKIHLNSETYIETVSDEVWNFQIGGYQVLDKWLSDRKDETLESRELLHYLKMIVSIRETIKIMKKIDE